MRDTPTHIRDYELLDVIAAGAHSIVHRAVDRRTGATVAIKQVTDPLARRHSRREAALLMRMRHPALPTLFSVHEDDDATWLVMECIPGNDLAVQIERRAQPFPLHTVLAWADQLLDALIYLHAQTPPIMHNDIKPRNLKLDAQGQVRLLDFGVAHHVEGDASGYTLAYAAPEQVATAASDPRSDLYALTATLYDLCTGVKPPDARLRLMALAAGRSDPLLPASAWNPALPHALDACLLRGMALDPAQRFADATEMREILRACQSGLADRVEPMNTARIIGREALIGEVRRRLLRPDVQLLTLIGPGGVGKTTVARAVASEVHSRHFRDVRFVDLEDEDPELQTPPTNGEWRTIQERFNLFDLPLPEESTAQKRPAPQPMHAVLLVLNGAELLEQDDSRLETILTRSPQLKVLATSRRPLHFRNEHLIVVPPLPTPDPKAAFDVKTALQSPAVQMLLTHAQALGVELPSTDENIQRIVELCAELEGLPLALEEAARALRTMDAAAIAGHLLARLRATFTTPASIVGRRHSLAASIAWSVMHLTPRQQRLLARLTIFRSSFSPHAAHVICCSGAPDLESLSEDETESLIRQLAAESLLLLRTNHPSQRYAMLATTRACASGCLPPAELDALRWRHADYFVNLVDRGNIVLTPDSARLEQLSTEYDELIAALASSIEAHEAVPALRLATALWRFWEIQGAYREGLDWLEQALALSATEDELRARALSCAGALARNQSQYSAAERCFTTALTIYQQLNDAQGVARMFNALGSVAYFQDERAAIVYFEKALKMHQMLGNQREMAGTLNNLALLAEGQADYPRAAALHQQALELFQTLEDDVNTAYLLGNLGVVAEHSGELAMATEYYQQSLELHERTGEKWGMAAMLTNLGSALGRLQRSQEALRLLIEGLNIFRELDDRAGMAQALSALAHNAQQRQAYQDATRFLATAERVEAAIGYVAPTLDQQERQELKATLHAALGATAFDTLWTAIDALPEETLLAELPAVREEAETP